MRGKAPVCSFADWYLPINLTYPLTMRLPWYTYPQKHQSLSSLTFDPQLYNDSFSTFADGHILLHPFHNSIHNPSHNQDHTTRTMRHQYKSTNTSTVIDDFIPSQRLVCIYTHLLVLPTPRRPLTIPYANTSHPHPHLHITIDTDVVTLSRIPVPKEKSQLEQKIKSKEGGPFFFMYLM